MYSQKKETFRKCASCVLGQDSKNERPVKLWVVGREVSGRGACDFQDCLPSDHSADLNIWHFTQQMVHQEKNQPAKISITVHIILILIYATRKGNYSNIYIILFLHCNMQRNNTYLEKGCLIRQGTHRLCSIHLRNILIF